MNKITNQSPRDALLRALKRILRPLVRLLISHQITFPALRDLLKGVYIEVAQQMIRDDGEEPSHSRLFILTGVHRKDIKRLSEQETDDAPASANLSLGGEIIARWSAQAEFIDDAGRPRALSKVTNDESAGFDQLVTQVSKDIRPRALLDEWLRQGLVHIENDRVVLNEQAFVPSADFDKLCYYLERNVHDHLASATHNLLADGDPLLERSVYYARLSADSIDKIREQAHAGGMALLTDLNHLAMQYHEQDKDKPNARHRFRFGCYWHQQETS